MCYSTTVPSRRLSLRSRQHLTWAHKNGRLQSTRHHSCHLTIASDFVVQLKPCPQAPDVPIYVLGVDHTVVDTRIGEFVMEACPSVLAVETAITQAHGIGPGATAAAADYAVSTNFRMLCQIAAKVASEKDEAGSWQATETWKQLTSGEYPTEQVAYVAALVLGAPLVYCDRPKDVTFRRLWALPTLQDLDLEFGRRTTSNYMAIMPPQQRPKIQLPPGGVADRIIMMERESVMCGVLEQWAGKVADGTSGSQSPNPKGPIVAVVGMSHLPGLEQLWEDGSWREMAGKLDNDAEALKTPPLEAPAGEDLGVRRALLERLLRLSAPVEVLQELEITLGQVGRDAGASYSMTRELYATCRMLLAMLPPEMLPAVCGQYECSMWEVLAPLRAIRPSQGGAGYSEDLIMDLRSLYIDVN